MKPLADSLRPQGLVDFFGQTHLLNAHCPLYQAINSGQLHSMLFWGPSGSGKTTLAHIISRQTQSEFLILSATSDGLKTLREVISHAKQLQNIGQQLVVFIDEIHRFNKAQQDALLPHIESGLIIFICATTENPAFEVNRALLSRLVVYRLEALKDNELEQILNQTLKTTKQCLTDEAKNALIKTANGDARRLLNMVQLLPSKEKILNLETVQSVLTEQITNFDKGGNIFYQQLSAFHKSVRGSSPDGALYWFARMVNGGCDAKVIARRLLAIASEDIGNADPRALEITLNAWDIYHRVGDKEGLRAIAQAVVYCAVAAKSNAVYLAWNKAQEQVKQTGGLSVPNHLCNAPDKLSQEMGLGQGYRYAHNEPDAIAKGQTYFPDKLGEQIYYQPTDYGIETKIKQRLQNIRKQK